MLKPRIGPTISRRQFLPQVAAAAAGGGAASFQLLAGEPFDTTKTRRGYFDIHVHLAQQWYGEKHGPLSAKHLLHWMDAHEIERAAVLPLVSPESFWYPITTEYVLVETQPHRDRLIPFCAIDPRALSTHLTEKQQVVDMLARYRDAGARGLGEHKPALAMDDANSMRLYEACSELKLPVLFHLDNKANMDQPGLPGLAKALENFSELPFIGHGKGWWASIAGGLQQADLHVGYPKGPVAPGGAIDALMDKFPNLYGDLSSSGAHALLRDKEFGKAFLLRRADRLLFGTDYYDLTQLDFQQFELHDTFRLPEDVERKIFYENAESLLGLS